MKTGNVERKGRRRKMKRRKARK